MSAITPRKVTSSRDWAEKLASVPKLSDTQKAALLQQVISRSDGLLKLGQGMIGPIQLRLRYEGLVRNVLVEDTLERGPVMPYDILDDLGQAYIMNATDSEVAIQVFEGKQVFPSLFRIAAQPRIRKEDLQILRVNAVEYAQDESRQAIQKQEDAKLVALLEAAIVAYGTSGVTPYGGTQMGITTGPSGASTEKTVLVGANGLVEPQDFYSAAAMVEIDMNEASSVTAHPVDVRDFYVWDTNITGFEFKDDVFARGEKVTKFGEFTVRKSVIIPQGELFLTGEPKTVGVFPVMYSLDVEENHQPAQFYKGWVMDEYVGMIVLNKRSLARVVKVDNYADITSTSIAGVNRANIQNRGLYA